MFIDTAIKHHLWNIMKINSYIMISIIMNINFIKNIYMFLIIKIKSTTVSSNSNEL